MIALNKEKSKYNFLEIYSEITEPVERCTKDMIIYTYDQFSNQQA